MKRFYPLAVFAIGIGATTCAQLPIDRSMAAFTGNDNTVVFSKDQKLEHRYVYLQVNEGSDANIALGMVVEPVVCKEASCIRYQFFGKDGSALALSGGIPKGTTQVGFSLKDLLSHASAVSMTDDGEYSVEQVVFYTGNDGQEYAFQRRGLIRLNVVSEKYRPVGCQDPSVAWVTKVAKMCEAEFTTAGRTAICGCDP